MSKHFFDFSGGNQYLQNELKCCVFIQPTTFAFHSSLAWTEIWSFHQQPLAIIYIQTLLLCTRVWLSNLPFKNENIHECTSFYVIITDPHKSKSVSRNFNLYCSAFCWHDFGLKIWMFGRVCEQVVKRLQRILYAFEIGKTAK